MTKKTIFSGIQPSGDLHIGNYIGAIKQWVELQDKKDSSRVRSNNNSYSSSEDPPTGGDESRSNELIFCIVDLHAITVYQDPRILREKILEVAALYIACGIDPAKSHIFVQSENPDHTYLAWIFDCVTPFGWMGRMTQFKEKSKKIVGVDHDRPVGEISVGLFNYPVLMAADILLYDTDLVPVGEDQIQHVELTRDIAERFNRLYSPIFTLPVPMIDKESARVMSLQNPLNKMSKSAKDPLGTINLLDSEEDIRNKIKRAVTDSGTEITYRADKPAISNLLVIYSRLNGETIDTLEARYKNKSYADFKKDLAEVVIKSLKPIQERYYSLRKEENNLKKALDEGLEFTLSRSRKKIRQLKEVMGLGR